VNRYLSGGGVGARGFYLSGIPRARRAVRTANRWVESAWLKLARPDLVHETYYQTRASAPKGCPVVVTVHDMIHERYHAAFGLGDATSAKKRAAVARADRVICVSENTRTDLIEWFGTHPDKIRTIHLGVSIAPAAPPATPAHLPKPFFLYVGMRGGYKNFANLLSAYASRAALRGGFDLIAFGADPFGTGEQESIRALGLASQVRHMTGDDRVLGHLYRRAAALVYPSEYEGFGIPPLEAMGYGCPVLCSHASSIPEIVGDAGSYFDPRRIDAIADAMEQLVSSQELRTRLVSRGSERARQLSWDRCAAKTLDLYRDLLARSA
jgi:glycosyltransferase involved in cell wall biosynthesis